MRQRALIINGSLAAVVIAIGVGSYFAVGDPGKAKAAAARTVAVSTGDVTSTVTGSGNLASGGDTSVTATQCSGKLTSISVKLGQSVRAGQQLATIDPTTAQQNLATAQANLTQAETSAASTITSAQQSLSDAQASAALDVSQQQAAVDRAQTSVDTDQAAVTTAKNALAAAQAAAKPNQQTISSAQNAYSSAQSKLAQDQSSLVQAQQQQASTTLKDSQQVGNAQTQLTQAQNGGSGSGGSNLIADRQAVTNDQTDLADCTLTAPVAGMITSVNGTVGATVGSSSSASGGSSSSSSTASSASSTTNTSSGSSSSGFATISDVATMQVTASIAEADIASVKVGQAATLTFPAVTDTSAPNGISADGAVSAIAPTSSVSSSVVTYTVTITLAHPPATVRLGQTTNVSITTAAKQDALRVTSTAISTTGGVKTVNRVKGASTGAVVVTTGVTGGGFTEILSGVQAGDELALPTLSTTSTTTGSFGGRSGVGGTLGG